VAHQVQTPLHLLCTSSAPPHLSLLSLPTPNPHLDMAQPALLKKIIIAKKNNKKFITLWGDGKAKREIIYADDVANAAIFFLGRKMKDCLINVGSGVEMTIKQYAYFIKDIIYPELKIKFDNNKELNGVKRKFLNTSVARSYGWKAECDLSDSVRHLYEVLEKKF
jgi:GDP-L-fucose synthase